MTKPDKTPKPFVFSIRPEFVARILDGSKRYEYRTRRPRMECGDTLLINQTKCGGVVASARLAAIIAGHPGQVWQMTKGAAGIGPSDYLAYFHGRAEAFALVLADVVEFATPIPLPAGMATPQSWGRWTGDWPMS